MKRKIILFIAMSLDGYIADDQDQLEFLDAYNDVDINKKNYEKSSTPCCSSFWF